MTIVSTLLPLDIALGVIVYWLLLGLAGLLSQNSSFITRILFPAAALGSLVVAAAAVVSLGSTTQVAVLPLGLPDLPFHLRLDSLSAFFLLLLGAASVGISLYSAHSGN